MTHALMHNPKHPCYMNLQELWLEESLANKIMLKYVRQNPSRLNFKDIERFVKNQPEEYCAGLMLDLYDSSDWFVLKNNKDKINEDNADDWVEYLEQRMVVEINNGGWGPKTSKRHLDSLFAKCFSDATINKLPIARKPKFTFTYNGAQYPERLEPERLVHAIIKEFVAANPCDYRELEHAFPPHLQDANEPYGCVKRATDPVVLTYPKFYFRKPSDIITLPSGEDVVVCKQWRIENYKNGNPANNNFQIFRNYVEKQLGFKIS